MPTTEKNDSSAAGAAPFAPVQAAPLCKDCRWFRRDWLGAAFSKCAAPQRATPEFLVAGKPAAGPYCSCERTDYETIPTCGRSGRYFEPRSPSRLITFLNSMLSA